MIAALVKTSLNHLSCKQKLNEQEDVVGDSELTWSELSQVASV